MDLDLSDGLTSAFGIPKELCDQFLAESENPACHFINSALAVGAEPLGVTFDALIENVGHINVTAESLGFIHFKEMIVKAAIASGAHSYPFR